MTYQEFDTRLRQLTTAETLDVSALNAFMTEVKTDYDERDTTVTTSNTLKSEIDKKDTEIDNLKKANYQMFLSLGVDHNNPPKPNAEDANTTPFFDTPTEITPKGDKELSDLLKALTEKEA